MELFITLPFHFFFLLTLISCRNHGHLVRGPALAATVVFVILMDEKGVARLDMDLWKTQMEIMDMS